MRNGWQTKTLGEVLQRTETINPLQSPEAEFDYIDVSSVSNATFTIEETQRLKGKDAPSRARKLVKANDVIFATIRPTLQRIAIVPDHLDQQVCSTGYFVLRAKPEVDHRFVFYSLFTEDFMGQMESLQKGASYPAVTDGDVRDQSIPVPPFAEQQRIVGLLDEAFAGLATALAHAEKNLHNARTLFESHLQSVFTQRDPGWVETTIGDQLTLQRGFDITKGQQSEGRIPVVSSGGIKSFHSKAMAQGPGVVIGRKGTLGKVFYLDDDFWPHDTTLWVKDFKGNNPRFVYYLFAGLDVKSLDSGTANPALNRNLVHPIVVTWPSVPMQQSLVETLDTLQEETQRLATLYSRKLAALEALKKSLLHQAFTGELTKDWREPKIVAFPQIVEGITTTDLHAGLLAMAYRCHETHGKQSGFGHVKGEKIIHLMEAFVGLELGRTPVKDAAGPNDFPHLQKVEHRARMADFFNFKRSDGSGAYRVTKLPKFDELVQRTEQALGKQKAEVDRLLERMVKLDWRQAEIVATVFAAWNNLLLDGEPISDERIVMEARENWHTDKLSIEREKFFKAIEWMKGKGLVPMGRGKKVATRTA